MPARAVRLSFFRGPFDGLVGEWVRDCGFPPDVVYVGKPGGRKYRYDVRGQAGGRHADYQLRGVCDDGEHYHDNSLVIEL